MKTITVLTTALALASLTGCARYVTPGRGAEVSKLAEADIQALMERKPAASFPARLVTRASSLRATVR